MPLPHLLLLLLPTLYAQDLSPPTGASLLTSNGAGTLSTTPRHLALANSNSLAYPASGGAALHDSSYVYTNDASSTTPQPPMPPQTSYTSPNVAPNIGTPVPYPMSFLQTHSQYGYRPYNPAIHHPMFSNLNSAATPTPTSTQPLPVSMYSGVAVQHHPIVLPTSPGNGFAAFVHPRPSDVRPRPTASMYPNEIMNPYTVQAGSSGHFQYPAFLQVLPESMKWFQPPDPKGRFGAGVPLTPSNDIRPPTGAAPIHGVNANKGTTQVSWCNSYFICTFVMFCIVAMLIC